MMVAPEWCVSASAWVLRSVSSGDHEVSSWAARISDLDAPMKLRSQTPMPSLDGTGGPKTRQVTGRAA